MVERSAVDFSRLVPVVFVSAVAMLVLGAAAFDPLFAGFVAGALLGAGLGLAMFALRSGRGLGATLTVARGASRPGEIDIAHIPAAGIGGLGLVAMVGIVAVALPDARQLLTWGVSGGVVGAGALVMLRHFQSVTPIDADAQKTLHLR